MMQRALSRYARSSTGLWLAVALVVGAAAGALGTAAVASPSAAKLAVLAVGGMLALLVAAAIMVRPWLGVPAMLLVLPLETAGRVISSPITLTLFHVVLFWSLASWLVHLALRRQKLRFSAIDVGLSLLVVAGAWSLPHSLNSGATIVNTIRLVFLWLFTLFATNQITTRFRSETIQWTLMGTGAFMGAFAFAQGFVPGFNYGNVHMQGPTADQLARPSAFYDDPNYLATFLSCAVLIAAARVVHARRSVPAVIAACLGAAAAVGVLVTYSRTAWLGVLVGLVIVAVTAPRKRRNWFLALGLAGVLVLGAVAGDTLAARIGSALDPTDASASTRVDMLDSTVRMIHDDWVWGAGLGAYDRRYLLYRRMGSLGDIIRPHEVPLALWAETGVLGLIAQLALLGGLALTFLRRGHRGFTALEVAALAGIVSLLIQALFQYYVYLEYVWLFFALAVISTRLARSAEEVTQ